MSNIDITEVGKVVALSLSSELIELMVIEFPATTIKPARYIIIPKNSVFEVFDQVPPNKKKTK